MGLELKRRLGALLSDFDLSKIVDPRANPPRTDPQAPTPFNPAGAGVVRPIPDVQPWAYRYPYGTNLTIRPRGSEVMSFQALRGIAKACELIRIAIQVKKEQIKGLDWDIIVLPEFSGKQLEGRRKTIKNFFRRPDVLNDLNFTDFISQWMEDLFVLDAATIWFMEDRAGRTISMTIVDGATIKPIVTNEGYVPMPPLPAYSQVIDGRNHGTYTRDEMLYCQYNPQSNSQYGMSLVEMVVLTAHVWMKRQLSNLALYTDGNVPDHLLIAPPDWNSGQVREVQEYLDAYFSGDVAKRHHLKLIPGGGTLKEIRQQDFTTAFEEHMTRIVSAIFGIAPHVLLMRQQSMSRQNANAIEQQQSDVGSDPFKKYLVETFNERIIRDRFGEEGLAFAFLSDKDFAEKANLDKAKFLIPVGAYGIDELRASEGKQPIGIPPYINMANGIIFLTPEVIADISSGKINFIDAGGTPHSIQDQAKLAAANLKTAQAEAEAAVNPPEPAPAPKPGAASAQKVLFDHEIGQFKRAVLNDIKKGEPAGTEFVFNFVPEEMVAVVKLGLERCTTAEEVKAFFSRVSHQALEMRPRAAAVCFSQQSWTQEAAEHWLACNGYKHSEFRRTTDGTVFDQVPTDQVDWGEWKDEGLPPGVRILVPLKG